MKTVCKKLLSLMLVAILLVSAVPFQASAAEGDAVNVPVAIYVNNSYIRSTSVSVSANMTLDADYALSLLEVTDYRSLDKWVSSTGKEFQSAPLSYSWLVGYNAEEGHDDYSLAMYITDSTPAPTPDPEPTPSNYTVNFSVKVLNNAERVFSNTYAEGEEITLNYGLIGEDSASFGSSATVTWKVNGVEKAHGSKVTVTSNMNITFNVYSTNTATIYLNANGGSVSPTSMTVVVGNPYPTLPQPSREGYTFQYWYRMNGSTEEKISSSVVANTATLYAKWVANGVSVTFQRYTNNGWEDVRVVPVAAGSTVSKPTDDFSYSYNGVNFNIVGWEIGESDVAFNFDSTQVTKAIVVRPRYQGTVTLRAQEPAQEPVTNAPWKSNYVTLEIGEPIGTLSDPGSRSTYAFDGWVASNGTTMICDSYCKSSLEYYPNLYGTTFYVKWAGAITVNLHIHTNGNTTTATKIVPYYVAPAEGTFDLSAINMYSIFPSYANYDDEGDVHYGWYSAKEWTYFCANRAAHSAFVYTDIEKNKLTDFHIMLIDNGNNTTYNTNSSTLDSSNPTTGDQIFMAVTVLAVSASALALMLYFNKKRKASN